MTVSLIPRAATRRRSVAGLLAILLCCTGVITACDSGSSPSTESATKTASGTDIPAVVSQILPEDIGLDETQSASVADAFAGVEELRAGDLWRLAGRLHETLTTEQIERMTQSPPSGPVWSRADRREARRAIRSRLQEILSDDQLADLRSLRTDYRATVQDLREDLRSGTLSEDAFFEARSAERQSFRDAAQAVLTESQLRALEERKDARQDRRSARSAARDEVLRLSDEQKSAVRSILDSRRGDVRMVLASARSEGGDREALRSELQTIRMETKTQIAAVLTDDQMQIVAIHRALARRAAEGEGARPFVRRFLKQNAS